MRKGWFCLIFGWLIHSFRYLKGMLQMLPTRSWHHTDEALVSFQLNGLIRLHLSGNKLRTFDVTSGCLPNLNVLDLSANKLSTVSALLWETLPSLATVDISSNPLNCDCALVPAMKQLSKTPSSSLNQVIWNNFKNYNYFVLTAAMLISLLLRKCLWLELQCFTYW